MFEGLDAQRLLALWDHDAMLWGLPLFPAALFLIWATLIALLAWLRADSRPPPGW